MSEHAPTARSGTNPISSAGERHSARRKRGTQRPHARKMTDPPPNAQGDGSRRYRARRLASNITDLVLRSGRIWFKPRCETPDLQTPLPRYHYHPTSHRAVHGGATIKNSRNAGESMKDTVFPQSHAFDFNENYQAKRPSGLVPGHIASESVRNQGTIIADGCARRQPCGFLFAATCPFRRSSASSPHEPSVRPQPVQRGPCFRDPRTADVIARRAPVSLSVVHDLG